MTDMNEEKEDLICGFCKKEYEYYKDHAGFCCNECACDFGRD